MNAMKIPLLLTTVLAGCGMNYEKTVSGNIKNDSDYTISVSVEEGCYGGATHKFDVAPGDSHDYKHTYTCNEHDDESNNIEVRYLDYPDLTYTYAWFYLRNYLRPGITPGLVINYREDDAPYSFTLKEEDIDNRIGVARDFQISDNVDVVGGTLLLKPNNQKSTQIFVGIASEELSPFLPRANGSFEEEGVVYLPMEKKIYKHDPSYNGQNASLSCDNFHCTKQ